MEKWHFGEHAKILQKRAACIRGYFLSLKSTLVKAGDPWAYRVTDSLVEVFEQSEVDCWAGERCRQTQSILGLKGGILK